MGVLFSLCRGRPMDEGVNAPGISRNPKPLFNLLFGGLWLDLPERDSDLIPLFIINPD